MTDSGAIPTLLMVPSLRGGGTERLVSILTRSFDRTRVAPSLVLLSDDGPFRQVVPEDVPVINLGKRSKTDLPRLVWRLSRILEDTRPQVAIGFMTYANSLLLAARAKAAWRPPVIVTEHNSPALRRRGLARNLRDLWARRLYPRASRLVVVSATLGEQMRALHPRLSERLAVIPNPFDPAIDEMLAETAPVHPWFNENLPVLVSVGRLSQEKGYADLINAVALLNRQQPVRAVVVGEGPERQRLQRLSRRLRVAASVDFVGFQANPFQYMARCSIFVHPALSEAFGTVLVEAARCGAAIVATDCDFGPREIIVHGQSGLLVPPSDPAALAASVSAVLADAALADALRGGARRRASAFTPDAISERYANLVHDVARERNDG